jgi:hypothetical protein
MCPLIRGKSTQLSPGGGLKGGKENDEAEASGMRPFWNIRGLEIVRG